MTHHIRPHAYIPAAWASTGTSIDELVRPGLHLAFPLPSQDDPNEATFRHLLDALAQRRPVPTSQLA